MMSALIHLTRLALCSSCSSMAFLVEHLLSGCPHQPLCTVSLSVDSRYIKTMWRVLNQNLTARLFHIWSSANLDQCFTWSINLLAKVVLGKMIINIWFVRTNKVPRTWIWFYSLFISQKAGKFLPFGFFWFLSVLCNVLFRRYVQGEILQLCSFDSHRWFAWSSYLIHFVVKLYFRQISFWV